MSLQNGAQVLVQRQRPNEGVDCVAFSGLAAVNPSVIMVASAGGLQADADADALYQALLREVGSLNPGVKQVTPACNGWLGDPLNCHAHNEPTCVKLLVLVGDGTAQVTELPTHEPWLQSLPFYMVLPVFPLQARQGVSQLLPGRLQGVNVDFWSSSIEEAIPAILSISGLSSESPRIFISYRQKEAGPLAAQLFDALAHENFDVFLDHFRISPGVDFQVRLTQELGDKSVLLLLETSGILDSQ